MTQIYIRTPFALSGDQAIVPNDPEIDGSVSYSAGYPIKYSQDPNTDGLRMDRAEWNYLQYVSTTNIQQYQQEGTPVFIAPADNGGAPFPYAKGARVRYNAGSGFANYESLVDTNNALPTVTTNWRLTDPYNQAIERASPAFTGTPTAPTATAGTSTTQLATTAFVQAAIASLTGTGVPTGTVAHYAKNTPPAGWIERNGASYSTTDPTYAPLFAVIGYTFGGSGASFKVPDDYGNFDRGWAKTGSIDGGRVFGSVQTDAFRAHTHTINANNNGGIVGAVGNVATGQGSANLPLTNSTGGTETRPYNRAYLPIIKL